ncbi:uncharacterized protein [Zea mays]|uniref:uncharacterized protein isoform X2 n=1 Tax=Zea mays TaxID=4577 RepID=UPI000221C272|nr:uncharacterized protein LOC103653588 isoform X2 [Zea mays]|eukprot:XP_020401865.1 uncharacterized protein LOC103653587 [Zea mays]
MPDAAVPWCSLLGPCPAPDYSSSSRRPLCLARIVVPLLPGFPYARARWCCPCSAWPRPPQSTTLLGHGRHAAPWFQLAILPARRSRPARPPTSLCATSSSSLFLQSVFLCWLAGFLLPAHPAHASPCVLCLRAARPSSQPWRRPKLLRVMCPAPFSAYARLARFPARPAFCSRSSLRAKLLARSFLELGPELFLSLCSCSPCRESLASSPAPFRINLVVVPRVSKKSQELGEVGG